MHGHPMLHDKVVFVVFPRTIHIVITHSLVHGKSLQRQASSCPLSFVCGAPSSGSGKGQLFACSGTMRNIMPEWTHHPWLTTTFFLRLSPGGAGGGMKRSGYGHPRPLKWKTTTHLLTLLFPCKDGTRLHRGNFPTRKWRRDDDDVRPYIHTLARCRRPPIGVYSMSGIWGRLYK